MLAQLDLFASLESQAPEEKIKSRRLAPPAIIEVEDPSPKAEKKISVLRPVEERHQAVTIGGEKKPENRESISSVVIVPDQKMEEAAVEEKTEAQEPLKKSTRGRKSIKEMDLESARIEIPADDQLYSKQYYAIGEVAAMFHVNASLLRYWESEFDLLKPRKNKKGDRFFRPDDIKHLKMIHHLLREKKYTIEGARAYLKKSGKRNEQFEAIESLRNIRTFLLELRAGL
jgi:DNA-binding transcriptional MerR regulator